MKLRRITPVCCAHGVLRNGGDYRDFWLPLVDEADLLVMVPEFSNEAFPAHAATFRQPRRRGKARPARAADLRGAGADLRGTCGDAGITGRRTWGQFGHSAGGQFVHRMLSLGVPRRCRGGGQRQCRHLRDARPRRSVALRPGRHRRRRAAARRHCSRFRLTSWPARPTPKPTGDDFPQGGGRPCARAQRATHRAHRYDRQRRAGAATAGQRVRLDHRRRAGRRARGRAMSIAAPGAGTQLRLPG